MNVIFALLVGVLFAVAVYLLLQKQLVKLLLGLVILGNAANLLIFVSNGADRLPPPIIEEGLKTPDRPVAEPVAQALVLTAIVIGLGVLAFTIALIRRVHQSTQVERFDELQEVPEDE